MWSSNGNIDYSMSAVGWCLLAFGCIQCDASVYVLDYCRMDFLQCILRGTMHESRNACPRIAVREGREIRRMCIVIINRRTIINCRRRFQETTRNLLIYTTKGAACVCKISPISDRTLSFRHQTSRNFFFT